MENTNITPEKTTKKDIFMVDPRNITVEEGFNTRFDYGNIDELSQSIVAIGVRDPLRGYKVPGKDEFVLTDGHRRFRAIQMALDAGHYVGKVPLISDGHTNIKDRTLHILISNDGKPLTTLELAETYRRLVRDHGMTQNEVAQKIGKSQAHVATTLKLCDLTEETKQAIIEGKISVSTVRDMLNKKSDMKDVESKVLEVVTAPTTNADKKVSRKDMGIKKVYTTKEVNKLLARQLAEIKSFVGDDVDLSGFKFQI